MAEAYGVSNATVARLWQAHGFLVASGPTLQGLLETVNEVAARSTESPTTRGVRYHRGDGRTNRCEDEAVAARNP